VNLGAAEAEDRHQEHAADADAADQQARDEASARVPIICFPRCGREKGNAGQRNDSGNSQFGVG